MNLGDVLKVKVDSVAFWGSGIARLEGCVIFIPGVCPGEEVMVRVMKIHPHFLVTELVSIETPSPDRITPVCRVPETGERVPGCVYDHVTYPTEISYKQAQFRDFLQRQGKLADVDKFLLPPVASPKDLHYRNKMELHVGKGPGGVLRLGYRGDDNKTVVDIPSCPLAFDPINVRLAEYRKSLGALREGMTVSFRWTPFNGVVAWTTGLRADGTLQEETCIGPLEVAMDGFFQVNPEVGDLLLKEVMRHIKTYSPATFIDIYSGVGVFALAAARCDAGKVYGIEHAKAAIALANRNAARLGLPVWFTCADAYQGASALMQNMEMRRCCVLVDPPRCGLCDSMRKFLAQRRPETILYVSCAPDTLVRDLAKLVEDGGYQIRSAQVFDMFPRTAHFESLTVLRREPEGKDAAPEPAIPYSQLLDS